MFFYFKIISSISVPFLVFTLSLICFFVVLSLSFYCDYLFLFLFLSLQSPGYGFLFLFRLHFEVVLSILLPLSSVSLVHYLNLSQ